MIPCRQIYQIAFSLDLPEQFPTTLLVGPFSKAVSNILANAVAYTEAGKSVSVYIDGRSLVIENGVNPYLIAKSTACLSLSIDPTSPGAGIAAATAWGFTSWIRF